MGHGCTLGRRGRPQPKNLGGARAHAWDVRLRRPLEALEACGHAPGKCGRAEPQGNRGARPYAWEVRPRKPISLTEASRALSAQMLQFLFHNSSKSQILNFL
ncbi:hypothetical protein TIFTF001_016674 [Ficus carica]|uniref:Uncharacterized protein n=1 Tax=Ficus carica TaxID=3494 RepID=A0AA88A863_FICCA|nr:hypothetical protein TIFTF001_016674 [Ficus carica]